MQLEMATFKVAEVKLGTQLRLRAGVLEVDPEGLRALLLADGQFEDVAIHIVKPGDNARVVHIVDVVEPRVRVSPLHSDFPGMLSAPRGAGSGSTNRLE